MKWFCSQWSREAQPTGVEARWGVGPAVEVVHGQGEGVPHALLDLCQSLFLCVYLRQFDAPCDVTAIFGLGDRVGVGRALDFHHEESPVGGVSPSWKADGEDSDVTPIRPNPAEFIEKE